MIDKLPKTYLILGGLTLSFLIYQITLSKSVEVYRQYRNLQKTVLNNSGQTVSLIALEQQKTQNDSLIARYFLNRENIQSSLLSKINHSLKNKNILLTEFNEPIEYNQENVHYINYKLGFEGDFEPVLQLLHDIEKDQVYGSILSAQFEKVKNQRTGKESLITTVILQKNIKV